VIRAALCISVIACAARTPETPPAPAASVVATQMPSDAPPPAPPQPVVPPGPAHLEAQPRADAGAMAQSTPDEASCATGADCALTRVAEGACCAMLCTPRVVSARRAQVLHANSLHCGRPCPHPLCTPERDQVVPACADGRCVGRHVKLAD